MDDENLSLHYQVRLCGADLPLYVNEGPICPSCLGRRSGQWNYSVAEPWNALSVAINRIRELEAKLRELYGYLLQADKDGESNIPQELGNEIEELLR